MQSEGASPTGAQLPDLPPHVRDMLDEAVRRIVEIAHPRLVILFGSYADGQYHEGSDLDLLVVAETESWPRLGAELRQALHPVLGSLGLDLLVYPPADWERDRAVRGFVARDADRRGVRIHESPGR